MGDKSGIFGFLGLAAVIGLFLLLRRFFPSLSTIFLVIGGILLLLLVVVVTLVIILAFRKPKPKAGQNTAVDGSVILSRGRAKLMELRRLSMQIKNPMIRKESQEICTLADKILRSLREQPENIPRMRQFLNYYLPTLGSILVKFVRLEANGVPARNVIESCIASLLDIKTALGKLHANLFG
ncbi:MAG: 5-bromo-4-chloroindolyl phosphate hydrolysis family protein [Bacillota bacterium]|nr:5-bromo-4-chloroindolyl phosphate hydrolysis family protein [Bacillota bacterium]